MRARSLFMGLIGAFLALCCIAPTATAAECRDGAIPAISFVQFHVPNIARPSPSEPPDPPLLRVKGKLSLPQGAAERARCLNARRQWPAVVILHGSAGVDSRGDFYEEALNLAGFATLQIDMWEARGVTSHLSRPAAPILTYPDAFGALAFLSAHPNIDRDRIGVLGFSWGGVVSLASAEQLYATTFGRGLKFAAHVANYPVCYAGNNTSIPALYPPAATGAQFLHLTGAPIMIQIGTNDDYDNGAQHCHALAAAVNPMNNNVVEVVEYPNAFHAWDRLMVPVTAPDPFANEGSFFNTGHVPNVRIVPDVEQAFESRMRVVRFFGRHLK